MYSFSTKKSGWLMVSIAVLMSLVSLACRTPQNGVSGAEISPTAQQSSPQIQAGRVVSVIDGAAINVEIEGQVHRVRYIGVEVPVNDSMGALAFNRFLVEGKTVQLERDAIESNSLGELLRYVYVNGEMANEAMIGSGYAVVSPNSTEFRLQSAFLLAEENAKANRRGIWEQEPESPPMEATPIPSFTGGTLPVMPR